ncbi:hypothetical protein SRHO_G00266830 [Serrasalmus rhombeus]
MKVECGCVSKGPAALQVEVNCSISFFFIKHKTSFTPARQSGGVIAHRAAAPPRVVLRLEAGEIEVKRGDESDQRRNCVSFTGAATTPGEGREN